MQGLRLRGENVASAVTRAPQWVTGLLVVALGAQAALIVTDLAGAGHKAGAAAAPTQRAAPANKRLDLAALVGANLFGRAPSAGANGAAPVTNMALVLVGVMAADDPQQGVAILGPSSAAAKVFLFGQTVPGGARLHAIYADRVLLDRNGTIEALMMLHQSLGGGGAPPQPSVPPPAAAVSRMQQLVRENPGLIGDIIRPTAVLADGRQRGYRVYPGPNQEAFNKLGLRAGDMVTAINGTPLDDPNRGAEIFGTLSSAGEARVTVMRNGRQQDLLLNLAQVAAEAEKIGSTPANTPATGQPAAAPAAQ